MESRPNYSIAAVSLLFSAPAIGGALFGYDIGSTSFVISQLQSPEHSSTNHSANAWWQLIAQSSFLQGMIVSAGSMGALVGSFLIFRLADSVGRKTELKWGAIFYGTGTAIQVLAGWQLALSKVTVLPPGWAISLLILGRLTYGVAIGVVMHAAPTYLAEMIPPDIRGLFVSLKEAAIVLGILLGYVVGYAFFQMPGGWVFTYAISWFASLPMLAVSSYLPESCRWLLLQNLAEEARQSMAFSYFPDAVQEEYDRLIAQLEECGERSDATAAASSLGSNLDALLADESSPLPPSLLNDSRYRLSFIAGVGLVVLQQITGQPTVLSYATPIFQKSGLSDMASIIVAAFKLATTLGAAMTVEKFGRKMLLYTGCGCMLVALIVLSFTFAATAQQQNQSPSKGEKIWMISEGDHIAFLQYTILVFMFLYIAGYQIGFGPISWLMISEVFPLSVRGRAVAVAVQVNFAMNAVVQLIVPVFEKRVGLSITFGIFAILTAYSICFVRMHVPETKGLTLEEVEAQFEKMRQLTSRTGDEEVEPLLDQVAGQTQTRETSTLPLADE